MSLAVWLSHRLASVGGLAMACGALTLAAPAIAQTVNLPPFTVPGIVPNATYLGEFASNPSGGEKQGAAFAGQLAVGADFDLQKLIDLQGAALHIEFTDRQGRDLSNDSINNSVSVQQIYGGGQTEYLTTLMYDQKLFGGVLDLQAGRTEIDQVVLQDPIYCQFQSNAICGQPDIMGKSINASFYPVPVWGGRALISPTDKISLSLGAFDYSPSQAEPGHNGFDFALAKSAGVLIPLELDYQTSLANDPYPRRYDVGVVFDRTPYTYTTNDVATQSLGSTSAYGRTMIYVQAKQMVYRPDPHSPRGLTLFGAVILAPDNNQPANYDLTAGAVYLGPFAARPLDSIGVAIGDTHYRSGFLNQLYTYRTTVLGGTQRPASDLVMAEVHYDAFLKPWLDVMPNLQYILNPDGLGTMPYPKQNLRNAFVIGVQFNVNLALLAGFKPAP